MSAEASEPPRSPLVLSEWMVTAASYYCSLRDLARAAKAAREWKACFDALKEARLVALGGTPANALSVERILRNMQYEDKWMQERRGRAKREGFLMKLIQTCPKKENGKVDFEYDQILKYLDERRRDFRPYMFRDRLDERTSTLVREVTSHCEKKKDHPLHFNKSDIAKWWALDNDLAVNLLEVRFFQCVVDYINEPWEGGPIMKVEEMDDTRFLTFTYKGCVERVASNGQGKSDW